MTPTYLPPTHPPLLVTYLTRWSLLPVHEVSLQLRNCEDMYIYGEKEIAHSLTHYTRASKLQRLVPARAVLQLPELAEQPVTQWQATSGARTSSTFGIA